jgi:hypothetical protein
MLNPAFRRMVARQADIQVFVRIFPALVVSLFFIFAPFSTRTLTTPSTLRRREAHQMSSPRWLARLSVPLMVGAALITSASVAAADTIDDAYLAKLRALGFTWPPDHDGYMINLGHHICIDRLTGWTPDQIAQDVHSSFDSEHLTIGDVSSMVSAAESTWCP